MGTTHFHFDDKRVLLNSLCRIMITFGNYLWVLSFNSLFLLLGFISKLIIRLCSSFRTCSNNKDDKIDLIDSPDLEPFGFFQSEGFHEYLFGFQFQTIEEEADHDDGRNPESDYSAITDTPLVHSAIKFQTFPVKAARGFLVTPEDVSFSVKEMFVNPENDSQMVSVMDVSVSDHGLERKQEEGVPGGEDVSSENREVDDEERGVVSEGDKSDETLSPSKEPKGRKLFHFDRERDYSALSGRTPFPVLDNEDEENDLEFLEQISDLVRNFEDDSKRIKALNLNGENQESLEVINREIPFTTCNDYSTEGDDDDEEGYIIDFKSHRELGFISERKSTGDAEASLIKEKNTFQRWDFDLEEKENEGNEEEEEEDDDGFKDILIQHRVMVEQLKMDAKGSRSGKLSTIMEECETVKMDLKPLRLEERLDHKDHMNEIQKVYRSYTEKMKKLDILNYQTVHAISFLHMKDPSPSSSSSSSHKDPTLKSPVSAIKTLIFSSMWPCKLRRIYSADPTVKSMAELHRDLETVYVGQACLSWEILQWQYDKSKELLLNDTDSQRSYGQAAIEFQQFQVLVHRFVENEAFQGSRVENYARDRCSLRTILQVPAIKDDDCLKNKTRRGEIKGAGSEEVEKKISIAALMDVIEESMRSFWEFIRADKEDATISISKSLLHNRGAEQQQEKKDEMELLSQLKTTLQKKEKRVKGIVKSGNCIVRKFQKKQKEGRRRRREKDEWTERQLIAQVELKLVGRVMNKTRLTQDQLIWCQMKLNNLAVIKGNIQIEPSFMLFPF
ncbi:uncharacterized protein LOC124926359 [Impatiens glandulifera]|uniref:uncharacterized protein LOC124926359 n=1 Tax=Impatiens glandulifera TaxID=253017 RepID=UPI001FB089E4|nr:uncharacterized protein LOC124926359 [Impatiens glandulifera]